MGNKGKLYSITTCLVFIFLISILPATSAKEITVDDDSGADFRLIQEAVNNSVPGDIIIVRPGTYTENIFVNITELTVKSESKNNNVQVKPLNDSESVFLIKADNVTISGFNITGANKEIPDLRGVICLENARNCSITGNTFIENKIGVSLYRSHNNTISENLFFNDELNEEILTYQADMNKMIGNTIVNGYITQGAESDSDLIAGNKISNGGIFVSCCGGGHIVSGNTISNCSTGIYAYDVGVNISNNRITNCDYGIRLAQASSRIDNNTILYCDVGIDSGDDGSGVELINNTVMSSAECGIVNYGDNKRIYNNYFNNTLNVRLGENRGNTWNSSLTRGTNIVGGPYIGGNFWAKPDGTGFSQICVDLNGDGIGDLPYYINRSEIDYLPLVSVSRSQESIIPVANFSTNFTQNLAPLTVQFTDLSKNAILWSWDFNGDGNIDSTDQNPIFVYTTPGNYTVNLTVSNGKDRDSKIQEIIVQKAEGSPTANFSTNVTGGQVPLSVWFTDLSQNITSREWDFNNDGLTDSGDASPVYVYTYPGVYTVNLTVSDEYGIASKTALINVLSENNSGNSSSDLSGGSSSGSSSSSGESNNDSRSSGRSSSSSGGGAGSSPESAKNVEAKEISQMFVTKGIPVKFDFTKNATPVAYISFDAKKTAGKITTIVEMLKNKSVLVSDLPEDEIYKSFNIWVGNSGFANAENLENAVICFRVDKSWIQDKNINHSSVTLNRYSEKKWNELPASLLKQDDRYLYFTARTPGFSPFAITGKTIVKEADNEVQPATVIEIQPEPDNENSGQYGTGVEKKSGQNSTEVELKPEMDKSEILSVLAVICLMACIFVPFVRKKNQK